MKVLLADHNRINRLVTRKMLAEKNIETDFVKEGGEMLDMLGHEKYDLILLDESIGAQRMIGLSRFIFNDQAKMVNKIPVIVLLDESHAGGLIMDNDLIDGVISKPYEAVELYNKISKHVQNPDTVYGTESKYSFKQRLLKYCHYEEDFALEVIDYFIENYKEFKGYAVLAIKEYDNVLFNEAWHKISSSNKIFLVSSLDKYAEGVKQLVANPTVAKVEDLVVGITKTCGTIIRNLEDVKLKINSRP